jgi:hypothetical protein
MFLYNLIQIKHFPTASSKAFANLISPTLTYNQSPLANDVSFSVSFLTVPHAQSV